MDTRYLAIGAPLASRTTAIPTAASDKSRLRKATYSGALDASIRISSFWGMVREFGRILSFALVAALLGACGLQEDATAVKALPCESNFNSSDWKDEPIATAKSIQRCKWLDGASQNEVASALGEPDERSGNEWSYLIGSSAAASGGYHYLDLTFAGGRVLAAAVHLNQ